MTCVPTSDKKQGTCVSYQTFTSAAVLESTIAI